MSVEVKHLSKSFGSQKAVSDVSFSVSPGEILGLLGPNGAGKSTTMRMITGYLVPDEGSVSLGGFDVSSHPGKVKQLLGYLPEHNPLYPDLYVREYLAMMCSIHGVPKASEAVEHVIQLAGLSTEASKKIGALSKGYKQRVGIAQALVHDPEVLILDEPISGLDPNQLVEIRELIKSLGARKTVIFSTHIMQEVQAICSRVVIIDKGKMIIDQPISFLKKQDRTGQRIRVSFERRIMTNTLRNYGDVLDVTENDNGEYEVTGKEGVDLRPQIFRFAVEKNVPILEMYQVQSTVEDVFQNLTRERT